MNPRVAAVHALPDYGLWLRFANGEERIFSVQPYLDYPVYRVLRDEGAFQLVSVFNGTVCWGEGDVDFDPDTLYIESVLASSLAV